MFANLSNYPRIQIFAFAEIAEINTRENMYLYSLLDIEGNKFPVVCTAVVYYLVPGLGVTTITDTLSILYCPEVRHTGECLLFAQHVPSSHSTWGKHGTV